MSIIGSYRVSGTNAVSGALYSEQIYNFVGFKPSGINDSIIMGVGLYMYSANNRWYPAEIGRIV